jgi:hypothetical protein
MEGEALKAFLDTVGDVQGFQLYHHQGDVVMVVGDGQNVLAVRIPVGAAVQFGVALISAAARSAEPSPLVRPS